MATEMATTTIYCPATFAAIGDIPATLLLRQLHFRLGQKGGIVERGSDWVYKSYADWRDELFPQMSVQGVRSIVNRLRNLGVVETARKAYYPLLYRINYQRLRDLFAQAEIPLPQWVPALDGFQLSAGVEIAVQDAITGGVPQHTRGVPEHKGCVPQHFSTIQRIHRDNTEKPPSDFYETFTDSKGALRRSNSRY